MIAPLRERFDAILAHPSRRAEPGILPSAKSQGPGELVVVRFAVHGAADLGAALCRDRRRDVIWILPVTNWWRTTDYLYDKDEHLFFRDSTYFNKTRSQRQKSFLEPRQRLGHGRPGARAAISADESSRPAALRAIVQGHGGENPDAASSRTASGARACSTRTVIRSRKPAAPAFSLTRWPGA